MKKSKVLSTPTRLKEISFDDFYEDEETSLRSERINLQKLRRFKHDEVF